MFPRQLVALTHPLPLLLVSCCLVLTPAPQLAADDYAPTSVPGLQLWLDAADATSVSTNAGKVTQWNDKSGQGRHATQATAADRPTYNSSAQVVELRGDAANNPNGQYFTIPDFTAQTVLIVTSNMSNTAQTHALLGHSTARPVGTYLHVSTDPGTAYQVSFDGTTDWTGRYVLNGHSWSAVEENPGSSPYPQTGTLGVMEWSAPHSGWETLFALNFSSSVTQAHFRANLDCHEVLVFNRALTQAERQELEGYLAHKWNLEAQLPAGHPFRNLPPAGSNTAPVADAGTNQSLTDTDQNGSESVSLDGSGSSDSDGTIASYSWSSSLDGNLGGGATPSVSLSVGTHTITLTVTDDDGATATDTVEVEVQAGSSGTWLPTQLAGLQLWLDAADASSISTSSGKISQWSDKSGQGHHASQATAGDRPTYNSSGQAVQLRGQATNNTVGEYFTIPDLTAQTVILVTSNVSSSAQIHGLLGHHSVRTPQNYLHITSNSAANYQVSFDGTTDWTGRFVVNGGTWSSVEENAGTDGYPLSATIGVMEWSAPHAGWETLFALNNTTTAQSQFRANLDCHEYLIFNRTLTLTERQEVEGYLAHKWNLAGQLPAGHPYKNAAPGGGASNTPPIADAGAPQTVIDSGNDGSESVSLDGSGSSDSDGSIVSYSWTSDLDGSLGTGATPTASLTVGVHTITLTVTDDEGATASDTVQVEVQVGSSGSWAPTQVAGLQLWLDAADTSSISQSGGGISQWSDKSGQGHHASQPTAGERPSYSSGAQAVQLRGDAGNTTNGQYFHIPDLTAQTVIVVLSNISNTAQTHGLLGHESARTPRNYLHITSNASANYQVSFDGTTDWTGRFVLNGGSWSSVEENPGNGGYPLTASLGVMEWSAAHAGWETLFALNNSGTAQSLYRANLDCHEYLIFNRALTTSERQEVEGYLAHKWNLAGQLPAGHPYKNAAPGGGSSNTPPVADAGADQVLQDQGNDGSEAVTLDGSASSDSDGSIVSYSWVSDLDGNLGGGATPTVTLSQGYHTITLTVTDDAGASANDIVIVDVQEGSSSGWSPTNISGLQMWLDAADATSLSLNGGKVAQWSDKSGQSNHATQATAGDRPDYNAGLGAVQLRGTANNTAGGQFLNIPDLTAQTVVVVTSALSTTATTHALLGHSTARSPATYMHVTTNTTHDYQVSFDGTTDWTGRVALNGHGWSAADENTGAAGGYPTTATIGVMEWSQANAGWETIFAMNTSGSTSQAWYRANLDCHEYLIFNRALTATERQELEGYLAHKWGLAGNLPAGHAFKDAPPGGGGNPPGNDPGDGGPGGGGDQAVTVAQAKAKIVEKAIGGCKNGQGRKCKVCVVDGKVVCAIMKTEDTPDPCSEQHSLATKYSYIDKSGFNHWHIAYDWQVGRSSGGCSPCGSGGDSGGDLLSLQVRRIHRYREAFLFWSSLGPGVFLEWDQLIQFYNNPTNGVSGVLFDVNGIRQDAWREKVSFMNDTAVDGVLWNQTMNAAGAMRLYSDDNWSVPTSDINALTTASVRTHDGFMAYFEVFEVCAADPNTRFGLRKIGRLAKYEDPNGNAIVIDHVHPVTTPLADCTGYWQISSVTDAHNRTATLTYKSTQVAGRWVVETINLPDGTSVNYQYDAAGLIGATLGNGEQTTLTRAYDADSQCVELTYDDPACNTTHRRKSVFLSTNTWVNPTDPNDVVTNQASDRVRMILDGSGDVSYLAWDDGVNQQAYIYEGGQGLTWLKWKGVGSVDGLPDFERVATQWDITQDETSFAWETRFSYAANASPVRIIRRTDNDGRQWHYGYDIQRMKANRVTYPDLTQDNFTFNDFNKVVQYTDRLGRVTQNTYDASGNRLSQTRGFGTTEASTTYATYNTSTKQMDSSTDANGNVTNYTYDSNHFLDQVIQPKDFSTDTVRPTMDYDYDALGRLVKHTDAEGRPVLYESSPGVLGYDSRNRLTHITYSDGSQEITTYGSGVTANLVVRRTNRNGIHTDYTYDHHGRIMQVTTAVGMPEEVVSSRTYQGGTNRMESVTDKGETSRYTYDYDDRRITSSQQANATTQLTTTTLYDAINRRIGQVDAYGRRQFVVFDVNDRITRTVQEAYPASLGAGVPDQATLAALARDLSDNADYVISDVVYDAEGQVLRRIDGRGIVDSYEYDSQGRLTNQYQSMATVPATATVADLADINGAIYTPVTESWIVARTRFSYDDHGNQTLIESPRSFDGHFNGSTFGPLAGAVTKLEYTGRNMLAKRIEAFGSSNEAEESFTYYKDGRRRTHIDFRGNQWTAHWHACCGRLQGATEPDGSMYITNTDFKGNVTHTAIVSGGVTVPSDDAPTSPAAYDWHNPANISTVNETTARFDGRDRVTHHTVWLQQQGSINDHGRSNLAAPNNTPVPIAGEGGVAAADGLTTRYEYDDNLTDSQGLSATYTAQFALLGLGAGADGYAVAVTNAEGETSVTAYDGAGRAVLTIDAEGDAVQTIYDVTVTNAAGDEVLQTSRIVDPGGLALTTHSQSDGLGRSLTSIDELGHRSELSYDANSNRVKERDALAIGRDCTFDLRDRDIICVDMHGDATYQVYDVVGQLVQQFDGEGVDKLGGPDLTAYQAAIPYATTTSGVTTCHFDERQRKTQCIDRVQGVTTYTYDANNNLLSIEDADSQNNDGITSYLYTSRNLLRREEFPSHGNATDPGEVGNDTREYVYDAARRLTRRDDQNGDRTYYDYDMANRLKDRRYPDGKDDSFGYDAASRLLTAHSERYAVTTARTYFDDGTVERESMTIDGQTYHIDFSYDAANRQTGVTYPMDPGTNADDQQLTRYYTARSQLAKLKFGADWVAGSDAADGFSYAANRRETSRQYANGVVTDFLYRDAGGLKDNLVQNIRSHKSGADIVNFSYTYDHNKRKETETDAVAPDYSQTFAYDDADRLTAWTRAGSSGSLPQKQDWTLSKVGDWHQTVYDQGLASEQVDNRNHSPVHEIDTTSLAAVPGQDSLRHDWKGNLTYNARRDQTYDWDYDNRLQRAYNPHVADAYHDAEALWHFDGTSLDSSGNGHDGVLNGASIQNAAGRHGSGALRLTGISNQTVAIADAPELNQGIHGRRSVSVWFKLDTGALTAGGKQLLLEAGGSSRGLNLYLSGGSLYLGAWNTPSTESNWQGTFLSTAAISENTWHHVTLVLDGTDSLHATAFQAYLDGQRFAVGAGSQLWSHGAISIGGLAGSSRFHDGTTTGATSIDGWIDECLVTNRALGPAAIYTAAERAVLRYDFDEASGPVVNQAVTGVGLNGALQNGAVRSNDAGHRQQGLDPTSSNSARVLIPSHNDLNLQPHSQRTVSLFFKLNTGALAASDSAPQVIYEQGGTNRGLNIYLSDGALYCGGWNKPGGESGWSGSFVSTSAIGENRWHHVAVTLDGGMTVQADTLKAYLDGEIFGSAHGSRLWPDSGNIAVGAAGGTTVFHDGTGTGVSVHGSIDRLLISNDALSEMVIPDLAGSSSYRYDALGRRVAKRVGARSRVFLCGGSQVLSEYVDGGLDRSYVYGKYVDEPITMVTDNDKRLYYARNHLYSVSAVTDQDGIVVKRYAYDAYGNQEPVTDNMPSVTRNYGFTGRRHDAEVGLIYFRSRYFCSIVGRFIARDELKYVDGFSMYRAYFCPNQMDPSGRSAYDDCVKSYIDRAIAAERAWRDSGGYYGTDEDGNINDVRHVGRSTGFAGPGERSSDGYTNYVSALDYNTLRMLAEEHCRKLKDPNITTDRIRMEQWEIDDWHERRRRERDQNPSGRVGSDSITLEEDAAGETSAHSKELCDRSMAESPADDKDVPKILREIFGRLLRRAAPQGICAGKRTACLAWCAAACSHDGGKGAPGCVNHCTRQFILCAAGKKKKENWNKQSVKEACGCCYDEKGKAK